MAGNDVFLRSVPSDADQDDVRLYDPTTADVGGAATITVSPATVAITGQSVALRVDRQLVASPVTVPITGQSVALTLNRRITVTQATVPIVGQSVSLRASRQIAVSPATVPITGQSVSLRSARQLAVSPATVAISGQSVALTYTPAAAGAFVITVSPATVAITGQNVTLTYVPVVSGHSNLPDGGGGDEASIAYWRKRQLEQNEAVQKIVRDALDGVAESGRHDDVSVAEETAEQLADVIASFVPATASAGELQRFAEMLEDEEDIELLLMAIA